MLSIAAAVREIIFVTGFVDNIKFIVTNPISYHQYQIGTDFLNTCQKLMPSFFFLIPYWAHALCRTTYKSYFNFVCPSHWALWYNLCDIVPKIIYSVNKITTESSLWKSVEMMCYVCVWCAWIPYRMHMMRKLFCQLFSLELRLSDTKISIGHRCCSHISFLHRCCWCA